jgi:multisubunit Na+/H+ antiporter MnhE subunit
MEDGKIIEAVAIIALAICYAAICITQHVDGLIFGSVVGAIVFVATKQYYNQKTQ